MLSPWDDPKKYQPAYGNALAALVALRRQAGHEPISNYQEVIVRVQLGRLCKSRTSRMRLLCIVQSRMRHRAAFVSLSIMYSNFAYSALTAVGIDSGIRW